RPTATPSSLSGGPVRNARHSSHGSRGTAHRQVRERKGPSERKPPVHNPSISRWVSPPTTRPRFGGPLLHGIHRRSPQTSEKVSGPQRRALSPMSCPKSTGSKPEHRGANTHFCISLEKRPQGPQSQLRCR